MLKRCPVATLEAARQFRRTRSTAAVPEIVQGVIARHVDRERQGVLQPPRSDLRLVEDLGLDSLSLIEISITLEDVFEVRLSDERLRRLQTLGEVERYAAEHLQTRLAGS
ncbi:MAG: phosphopantetheine-binding protein [Opitutales bacterium]